MAMNNVRSFVKSAKFEEAQRLGEVDQAVRMLLAWLSRLSLGLAGNAGELEVWLQQCARYAAGRALEAGLVREPHQLLLYARACSRNIEKEQDINAKWAESSALTQQLFSQWVGEVVEANRASDYGQAEEVMEAEVNAEAAAG